MTKFNRILSMVIVVIMSLALIPAGASAAMLPEDVIGTKHEEAVALLQALGIMVGDAETGDFRLEDSIRRSEVAKIAVTMAGMEEVAQSSNSKSVFPDVVDGHWGTGYINVAAANGFVIGDDNGNFRPDDPITYAEAATIMVRVLGHEPTAIDGGGFPTGYMVTAGSIGVLKGASGSYNESATRGTVAQVAYNSLTIDLMEKKGYGDNAYYEIVDKNLLNNKLNVTKYFGQLTANNQTSMTGSSNLKANQVTIKMADKSSVYTTSAGLDTRGFIGRNVVFYLYESESTNENKVILIRKDASRNDELTVTSSNIDSLSGQAGETRKLNYWINKNTDKKTTEAVISKDATIFYNGVANSSYNLDDITKLTSGNVTLVDTNNEEEYNLVFVTEYQNIVVDDVSTVSHKINDKYNLLSLTLDPENRNLTFSITKNGEEIGIEEIKEWDILSVTMDNKTSALSTVINVYVSDATVSGKITEVHDGKYVIDGKEYEVAANYVAASQPELKLNDEGIFHLDVEGKIAAVNRDIVAGSNYAYITKAEISNSIDGRLNIKMFGTDGTTSIVTCATKIKINDKNGLEAEAALAELKAANGGKVEQLITFERNANGEIYYINTAKNNTSSGSGLKNVFSLDFVSGEKGVEYIAASKKLGNYNVNSSTIVLEIPAGVTDTDKFAVRNMDMFIDGSFYDVEMYDVTEDLAAKLIIVRNSTGDVNAENSAAVVTKVATVQNSDSMTVHKLYAVKDGQTVEVLTEDTTVLVKESGSLVKAGDIIQYQTNSAGEIDRMTVLFDSEDRNNDEVNVLKQYEGTEMSTIIGKVTKKFANSINITANNMAETNLDISNAKVYSYDCNMSANSQVSIVDASYITRYDEADPEKVFVRIYKGVVTEVVIIQER